MDRTRVGLVGLGAAGVLLAVWASYGPFFFETCCHPLVTTFSQAWRLGGNLLWVAVMLVAYRRSPAGPVWKLVLFYLAALGTWVIAYIGPSLMWTLAQFFSRFSDAVFAHLVLAFPTGLLSNRFDRVLVGSLYVASLLTQAAVLFFWDPIFTDCTVCPRNVFVVVPNTEIADAITSWSAAGVPIVAAIVVWRVWHTWRTASPSGRRILMPVVVTVPFAAVILALFYFAQTIERDEIRVFLLNPIFQLPFILLPAGFLIGILRSRLARGAVADLAVELGRGVSLGNLRTVMARALRDPSLELAFQAPSGSGYVDAAGEPIDLPHPGSVDRAVTPVERDGETVAVLIHDPGIEAESPGLIGAAGSVAALALQNERLSAQVRAQLEEVRASRARIVEAGDTERRRIERDLHDGAQQRLVALALRLQTARATTVGAGELLDQATAELQAAVAEVRDIGRGLHPPILTERGLGAALEALAERASTPIRITASDDRYPASVEAAAYFVAAEALTNVDRYASAASASMTISADERTLTIEIADDGVGGADPAKGSGLRGLVDRVAALGGELTVSSSPGGGTTVRAEIPLS
ncbi:MAG TPA: histidine kinase [Candidatus Limnocylindrales bacterium]